MPVVKTIIKNTNNETVVKVAGTAAAATIDLSTDLVASTQATDGATQTVNIAAVQWVGLPSATVTIARNATTILTLPGGGAETLDFANGNGYVDNISNTDDITVTIAGAYDNETAVGS
jgi:hypothetical protein